MLRLHLRSICCPSGLGRDTRRLDLRRSRIRLEGPSHCIMRTDCLEVHTSPWRTLNTTVVPISSCTSDPVMIGWTCQIFSRAQQEPLSDLFTRKLISLGSDIEVKVRAMMTFEGAALVQLSAFSVSLDDVRMRHPDERQGFPAGRTVRRNISFWLGCGLLLAANYRLAKCILACVLSFDS